MDKYDYNVFFVSSLGINDVAKPGEGISAPGKDVGLDPDRSSTKELKQALQKHWSNRGESSLLSAYENEDDAKELAHKLLREGSEATIVVIYMRKIVRRGVKFRDARVFAKNRLDLRIPDLLYRHSESEHLFFNHIPDFGITEIRQLRRIGQE